MNYFLDFFRSIFQWNFFTQQIKHAIIKSTHQSDAATFINKELQKYPAQVASVIFLQFLRKQL